MSRADRLSWTIARLVAPMPAGTAFTASNSATLGVMLSRHLLGCRLSLCGRGGAYDVDGILSLHARHWLFNRRPHAHVTLPGVFETQSEPHALLATPAQVDGHGNANLSGIGESRATQSGVRGNARPARRALRQLRPAGAFGAPAGRARRFRFNLRRDPRHARAAGDGAVRHALVVRFRRMGA